MKLARLHLSIRSPWPSVSRHAPARYMAFATMWLVLSAFGCGKKSPELGQVDGTVRVNGTTHAGLVVRFLPDPDGGNNSPINASGKTDAQGKYTLRYVSEGKEGDGAPVGWHRVLIEDASHGATPQGQVPPPSLVPVAYGSPAATPLKKEVTGGPQTIDLDVKK